VNQKVHAGPSAPRSQVAGGRFWTSQLDSTLAERFRTEFLQRGRAGAVPRPFDDVLADDLTNLLTNRA
jgi:hypothetical protein